MSVLQPERIAIIGGGCTGTTCFWALQHTTHDVHLFEASAALGGRIKEYRLEHNGNKTTVNTEMPSFNAAASPNLVSLLRHLGITTSAIPFTFSISNEVNTFEWGSSISEGALRQLWALLSVETYRTLVDVVWFKYFGADTLSEPRQLKNPHHTSIPSNADEYFSRERYSTGFSHRYLSSLLSVLWRTNALKYLPRLPIKALVHCLRDHGFFCVWKIIPKWCRVDTGASQLIQTMARKFPSEKIHLYTKVQEIQRCGKNGKHNYRLLISDGRQLYFNRVVFAIDSREILNILRLNVDPDEKEILRDLCTVRNIAVLHSDHSLASDIDHSWPACNYVVSPTKTCDQQSRDHLSDSRPLRSCLTYNVNALQDIPACLFGRVFITVNPLTPPHPRLVHGVWEFTDPGPTPAALYAQSCLPSIQNTRGLSYGFRWMGRGFLEDSVSAGLEIAIDHFGAKLPFKFSHPTDPMDSTDTQRLSMSDHLVRIVLSLAQTYVLLCEICWFWLRNTWARSGS